MTEYRIPPHPEDLLPLSEACKLIPGQSGSGIHPSTLYRWIRSNQIRSWKVGRRLLVSRADVLNQIKPVAREGEPEPVYHPEELTEAVLRSAGIRT